MRKLFDATGLPVAGGMEEALRRMEAGEDPEKIEEDMGEVLEGDPFGGLLGGDEEKDPDSGREEGTRAIAENAAPERWIRSCMRCDRRSLCERRVILRSPIGTCGTNGSPDTEQRNNGTTEQRNKRNNGRFLERGLMSVRGTIGRSRNC